MTRLALDPARVAAEIAEFSGRMALAAQQLATMDVRAEGCSRAQRGVSASTRRCSGATSRRRRRRDSPPLVICYALVNRPYMMDLQPDRSLIRGLLARGLDVYLVEWGYPDRADRAAHRSTITSTVTSAPASTTCASAHGIPAVNLLGVCQGGTMSLCHAALLPGARAEPRDDGDARGFPHATTTCWRNGRAGSTSTRWSMRSATCPANS